MSESHYLTCMDDNCERAYCVGRREFESKLKELEAEVERYKAELKITCELKGAGISHELFDMVCCERDAALAEVERLSKILSGWPERVNSAGEKPDT